MRCDAIFDAHCDEMKRGAFLLRVCDATRCDGSVLGCTEPSKIIFTLDMAPAASTLRLHLLEEEQMLLIMKLCILKLRLKKRKRKHRWWVHNLLRLRHEQGAYNNLVKELDGDAEKFQQFFRMKRADFALDCNFDYS